MPLMAYEVCNLIEAQCACALPEGHLGSHACTCGGRWLISEAGTFIGVRPPGEGVVLEPREQDMVADEAGIAEFRRLTLEVFGLA